jgi:hypothetical protein
MLWANRNGVAYALDRTNGQFLRGTPFVKTNWYTGFDEKGARIERIAEGWHARVVQHECDHLIGVLYPMRIRNMANFGFTDILFPELDGAEDD